MKWKLSALLKVALLLVVVLNGSLSDGERHHPAPACRAARQPLRAGAAARPPARRRVRGRLLVGRLDDDETDELVVRSWGYESLQESVLTPVRGAWETAASIPLPAQDEC